MSAPDSSLSLCRPTGAPITGLAQSTPRLFHLDMIRGLAALLVFAQHLRKFQFTGAYMLTGRLHAWDKIFYFATSLAHEAVVLFFVLSGFFVGGAVLRDFQSGTWSWPRYVVMRLTRLYVVLLPALLLTYLCSRATVHAYPAFASQSQVDGWTLLGNLAFLQSIGVTWFGGNLPLWSLAYEFWYYALFPLAMMAACSRQSGPARLACGLVFVLIVCTLPPYVRIGGLIWLLGVFSYLVLNAPSLVRWVTRPSFCALALLFLLAVLLVFKPAMRDYPGCDGYDLLFAVPFALAVPGLAAHQPGAWLYRLLATALADISYTLYLVHFPIVVLLYAFLFRASPTLPSPVGYLEFTAWFVIVLGAAVAMWWCFESRTHRIRRAMQRALGIASLRA